MANQEITLNHLVPYMKNINCTVIVLDGGFSEFSVFRFVILMFSGAYKPTAHGSVYTLRVADISGSINATIMYPDYTERFDPGDILKIKNASGVVHQSRLQLGVNYRMNGECKKSGEFCMIFNELPNFSDRVLPENLRDPRDQQRQGPPSRGQQRHQPPRQPSQPRGPPQPSTSGGQVGPSSRRILK
ncbi:Protein CBG06928 [Caenorhabditis briggsae]|uniref:Protein CBG06928 n=1 Tax=Caenorhabditis briggsae TaxID=6238 RepID=A8X3D9_CAEBR|nr:Protein CBG06928 [Caenorhabditis briggsae]CAP27149.2 Protein CBG06928 [Caenorhabditis briggsae]